MKDRLTLAHHAVVLASDGRILDPCLHDYEVRSIRFGDNKLLFLDAHPHRDAGGQAYRIECADTSSVTLETDCIQNVIMDVFVYPPATMISSDERSYLLERLQMTGDYADRHTILLITPAAGIWMAVACAGVTIHRIDEAQ